MGAGTGTLADGFQCDGTAALTSRAACWLCGVSQSDSQPSIGMSSSGPRFGLVGSFKEDDVRLAAGHELRHRLLEGAGTAAVSTAQVRAVLASLPLSGRVEFCAKSLLNAEMNASIQKQNGELITQLFRECFDAVVKPPALASSTVGKAAAQMNRAASAPAIRPEEDEWVIISLCTDPSAATAGAAAPSAGSDNAPAAAPPAAAGGLLYLKSSEYYVLHALVSALSSFGAVSVILFDEYFSRTTSTVFRSQFVKAAVALPSAIFSDERLERVYHSSVEAVRRIIESECKLLNGQRAAFLSRLIVSGATAASNELIHHATPALLEERFLQAVQVVSDPSPSGTVLSVLSADWLWKLNFSLHGEVYLRFLTKHLEAHADDPLWCGRFLAEFHAHLLRGGCVSACVPAAVGLQLFRFYQTYRPLVVKSNVPAPVKEHLLQLSKKGELSKKKVAAEQEEDELQYAGLERVVPPPLFLRAVSSEEKWRALKSLLVRTPDGFAFAASFEQLCETLLEGCAKKASFNGVVTQTTLEMLAALSSQQFYRMVFDADKRGGNGPVATTLRSFLDASLAIRNIRFSQPVFKAWLNLHLKYAPTAEALTVHSDAFAAAFKAGRTEEMLWETWSSSIIEPIQQRLVTIAGKAAAVLNGSSVRTARSPITSYVGYAAILAEQLLLVLERCASGGSAPLQVLQNCLSVLDLLVPLLNKKTVAPLYPPVNEQEKEAQALGLRVIAAVRSVGDRIALLSVSSVQRMLEFDLSSPQYARLTSAHITPQLNRLASATNVKRFPALAPALYAFYVQLLEDAKLPEEVQQRGFVMVAPPATGSSSAKNEQGAAAATEGWKKKQISWVHVNAYHHHHCTILALDKLEAFCSLAKSIPALVPLATQAWKIVRPVRYFTPPSSSPSRVAAAAAGAMSDADHLKTIGEFQKFMSACCALPSSISESEKPLLLAALVHHLKANNFRDAASGSKLAGWWKLLLSAVDACGADWPSRTTWLHQFGDISLAPVREYLQQATHDRDPSARQQAYLHLLRVSLATSWREFSVSLEFVQRRTKNEAGLYRRDIYALIATSIPKAMAESMQNGKADGNAASVAEKEALASVELITDSLVQILRGDLSKRDSVAKGVFHTLGRTLITSAIACVAPPLLSIRRAWVACGLTLDFLLLRARAGEDAGRKYVWPIAGTVFSREQWINEEALAGPVQAAVMAGVKGGDQVFASLRQRVYSAKQHVHVAPDALYTPEQAVELLLSTLNTQRQQQQQQQADDTAPMHPCDFLVDGVFFPSAEDEGDAAASAAAKSNPSAVGAYQSYTLQCMQQLVLFCGVRWTSVPVLVHFFERVIATVADESRSAHPLYAPHCQQTFALFNTVRQLYGDGAAWYDLAPLSCACTVLFASAVRRFAVGEAQALRPLWSEMKMQQGKMRTLASLTFPDLAFVVSQVIPLRGRHAPPVVAGGTKSDSLLVDKADSAERAATVLRDLLSLSPSALHVVWSELLATRDDIFSHYLGRTRGDLYGIFDPAATSTPAALAPKLAAEESWFPLTSSQLISLNARAMQTFTRMCMDRAMNQSLSPAIRSAAITQFVQSPAASHLDVIALIKKLHAVIDKRSKAEKEAKEKKEEGGAAAPGAAAAASAPASPSVDSTVEEVGADDAVDLLLESVILRVFDTDATWFVLAFLLDPQTIERSPQRTTATILTNLRLFVPVDRTVAVLRVLLEPHRRWAIGFFLHKQILRLLFECSDSNAVARALFLAEWQQRHSTSMPTDVRHEVIKMCVQVLNERNEEKQALAWSIVEDLVDDTEKSNVDTPTLMLLFTPTWQPRNIVAGWNTLDDRAVALSTMLRVLSPPRVHTAGGAQAPDSFGYLHTQFTSEAMAPFHISTSQMRVQMAALMGKLSLVCQQPYVRLLAQLQQFLFSSAIEGLPDDKSIERLHDLLMQATSGDNATDSSASAASSPLQAPSVVLEHTTDYALEVIPRFYVGLSLQVLTRALVLADPEKERPSWDSVCANHPYAIRVQETVGKLLQALLHTPPVQAARRMRVSKALLALMKQVSQTPVPSLPAAAFAAGSVQSASWSVTLIQSPFKDLLNFLRQDGASSTNLLPGVDNKR